METATAALGPLDLVKLSALNELPQRPPLDVNYLAIQLEDIAQTAAGYINLDMEQEFLYKNPNGWKRRTSSQVEDEVNKMPIMKRYSEMEEPVHLGIKPERGGFETPSVSTTREESLIPLEPWSLVGDFDFRSVVRQITEFIESWELTPATKFVVIAQEKSESIEPFGERYYVEAHFSKPTPKCPNPLAVAKAYFHINVCHLLPRDYPVNVTYIFEGYRSVFYAMGEKKMTSNTFQRFMIDTILHMKLAFFAELNECRQVAKFEETEEEEEEEEKKKAQKKKKQDDMEEEDEEDHQLYKM